MLIILKLITNLKQVQFNSILLVLGLNPIIHIKTII